VDLGILAPGVRPYESIPLHLISSNDDLEFGPVFPPSPLNWEQRHELRALELAAARNEDSFPPPSEPVPSSEVALNGNLAKTPLGEVLLHAARLATVMRFHNDKSLLETRLSVKPPLHPCRTLDQHFYWMLKETRPQDKTQVIYRATNPNRLCSKASCVPGGRCQSCLQEIRKVPKLIMVDQLWLWILDGSK
jgi:hypothetical protein